MLRPKNMITIVFAMLFVALLGTSVFAQEGHTGVVREAPFYTPTIDGTISASEASSMMTYTMEFESGDHYCIVCADGDPSADVFGADFYVSYDNNNLYMSSNVTDNVANHNGSGGNNTESMNSGDVIQTAHWAEAGPEAGFDFALGTALNPGNPDIYRNPSGPPGPLSTEEYNGIINGTNGAINGSLTTNGYIIEAAVPWAIVRDDSSYTPTEGDLQQLSFLLKSTGIDGEADRLALDTFGWGEWNWVQLGQVPEPTSFVLLGLGGMMLLFRSRRR